MSRQSTQNMIDDAVSEMMYDLQITNNDTVCDCCNEICNTDECTEIGSDNVCIECLASEKELQECLILADLVSVDSEQMQNQLDDIKEYLQQSLDGISQYLSSEVIAMTDIFTAYKSIDEQILVNMLDKYAF